MVFLRENINTNIFRTKITELENIEQPLQKNKIDVDHPRMNNTNLFYNRKIIIDINIQKQLFFQSPNIQGDLSGFTLQTKNEMFTS